MNTDEIEEVNVEDLYSETTILGLTDAVDNASDQDKMTWLVEQDPGPVASMKRVAAVVPVSDAEYLLARQAELLRPPGRWDTLKGRIDNGLNMVTENADKGTPVGISTGAGLALARIWIRQLEDEDGWDKLKARLEQSCNWMGAQPDAGSFTNHGLWDGLSAVLSWAKEIERFESNA